MQFGPVTNCTRIHVIKYHSYISRLGTVESDLSDKPHPSHNASELDVTVFCFPRVLTCYVMRQML